MKILIKSSVVSHTYSESECINTGLKNELRSPQMWRSHLGCFNGKYWVRLLVNIVTSNQERNSPPIQPDHNNTLRIQWVHGIVKAAGTSTSLYNEKGNFVRHWEIGCKYRYIQTHIDKWSTLRDSHKNQCYPLNLSGSERKYYHQFDCAALLTRMLALHYLMIVQR